MLALDDVNPVSQSRSQVNSAVTTSGEGLERTRELGPEQVGDEKLEVVVGEIVERRHGRILAKRAGGTT